ncbi:Ubiquitin carboxyl-terminal hydrolase 43, partial [Dryobates pubescens]
LQSIVSKHSAQFRGNAQHDALEFLLWLLDRMHEDLGTASPAQHPRGPDQVAPGGEGYPGGASPMLVTHSLAMFHRSSLTCPHCLKQSNTFDPFLCISLPIPLRQTSSLHLWGEIINRGGGGGLLGMGGGLLGKGAGLLGKGGGLLGTGDGHLGTGGGYVGMGGDHTGMGGGPVGMGGGLVVTGGGPVGTGGGLVGMDGGPVGTGRQGPRLTLPCLAQGAPAACLPPLRSPLSPSVPRFGPPLVLREERGISWEQLQHSILGQLRALLRAEPRAQGTGVPLFRLRLAGGTEPCTYLSPQDPHPLCHPAIDRALQLSGAGGPPHVKLTAEWDLSTKER